MKSYKYIYHIYQSNNLDFNFNKFNYLLMKYPILIILAIFLICLDSKLVFTDEFDTLDMHKWKHDITLSGGGNW